MPFDPLIVAAVVLIAWVTLRVLGGERRQRLERLQADLVAEAAKRSESPEPATSVR